MKIDSGKEYENLLISLPLTGMTNDPRSQVRGKNIFTTNFDIFTDENRLTPYRASEDGDSGSATSQKQAFQVAHWLPGSTNVWRLFSLGVISGTGKAEVLMKDLTTGAATDLDDNGWATPANNQSAAGSTSFFLFHFYKKTGLIYGARAGTSIWAFDAASAGAWADTSHSLSYTNIAQAITHSKDDIMYTPYDNKIAANNNGSWTDAALTLPAHLYITSICEFRNFIAIMAAPLSGVGKSRVFIWDRNTSLVTVDDSVDWGEGIGRVIEELEGYLIGISYATDVSRSTYRIIYRVYTTWGSKKFHEFTTTTSPTLFGAKQKINDRILHLMKLTVNGSRWDGIWSIGHLGGGEFAVTMERTANNDTVFSNGVLKGFYVVGDYAFISYVNEAGDYALSKTDDQPTYPTAIIETVMKNAGDTSLVEKLMGITTLTQPLPSSGKVVAKYRKNEETSYRQIFSNTVDNSLSQSANQINDITEGGDIVTMTIASPCVVTLTAHGLIVGDKVRFTTTGALPTGITAGTVYYVISAGLTSGAFEISDSSGGAAINTSGAQSGVHTMTRVDNFNEGQEYYFRLEYSGGATPTGGSYKAEVVGKRCY